VSVAATVARPPAAADGWQVPAYDVRHWCGRTRDACVIVPVINEGERIARLLDRMVALSIHESADVIIVDGGSRDGSLEPQVLGPRHVAGLLVKTGPGRLSAQLRCAYAFALHQGYARIVTIDGNDKDDPEAIARFLAALEQGYDFVQASRFVPGGIAENTPMSRTLAIRLLHAPLLSLASGFRWTDTTQGFRGYSAKLLLDPRVAPFRDVFVAYELLAYLSYRAPRLGYRCVEIGTTRRYPADGTVPTKIGGIRGNWTLLETLLRTCLGRYDPESA
jgi:dolichol-phosphate mannosyltransferase